MQITVKLFATFRAGRFAEETWEYPQGTRVTDIIHELGIAEKDVGMIMLNNRHAEPDRLLSDGDSLALFPLVGGG